MSPGFPGPLVPLLAGSQGRYVLSTNGMRCNMQPDSIQCRGATMLLKKKNLLIAFLITALLLSAASVQPNQSTSSILQQGGGSDPPDRVVKLVFIHHSTGENWLTDGYGNLGIELAENNYYVSDTNYGWGPNGIGDRTDIPDWLEWFAGEDTALYMQALYNESEQHASYTRTRSDPGGQNEIIMFKSCFPNSDLEGNPDDSPSADGWLSVGHAKYVYNQILAYFGQHPEKLFIVVTAPPLSDRSSAANARAFNLWLVNDWLNENNYPSNNVAVFDFYNILTGKDGHHTFENGELVHQVAGKDTLHYPSGDDHPSKKGSQKATEEFIPLLNYYYQRWQAENPSPLPSSEEDGAAEESGEDSSGESTVLSGELSGLLDDFEGGVPSDTGGWEAYWDEGTPTALDCSVESAAGSSGSALRLDYHVTPYSWGTCGVSYDSPQDWSASAGLVFSVHSEHSGDVLHVDLYSEGSEGRESYLYQLALDQTAADGWREVAIPWSSFHRVEWEADAGAPFASQDSISGLAFGFGTEEEEIQGTVWFDEVGWMGAGESSDQPPDASREIDEGEVEQEDQVGLQLPCLGALVWPVSLAGAAVFLRKKPPGV